MNAKRDLIRQYVQLWIDEVTRQKGRALTYEQVFAERGKFLEKALERFDTPALLTALSNTYREGMQL